MRSEATQLVVIPRTVWDASFAALAERATRALARIAKAPPGERHEAARFEAICRDMEKLAAACAESGAIVKTLAPDATSRLDELLGASRHPWAVSLSAARQVGAVLDLAEAEIQAEPMLFELRYCMAVDGDPEPVGASSKCSAPAEPWRASEGVRGRRAVEERWEQQLESTSLDGGRPLVPSGVSNRVLTEGLRKWVVAQAGHTPLLARIVYRDGTEARPFPLRSLRLQEPAQSSPCVISVALMSMRHPEMDVVVDAAWLRNRIVSQVRPQAETDELVYQLSRRQLADFASAGGGRLNMYQTGLQPAVVGFYRALADHLTSAPGTVEVVPFYFDAGSYTEGSVWATS